MKAGDDVVYVVVLGEARNDKLGLHAGVVGERQAVGMHPQLETDALIRWSNAAAQSAVRPP